MTSIFDKLFGFGRTHHEPPAVLVTGPQRSGTRIATKMVAADLGYEYHDEREIDIDDLTAAIGIIYRGGVALHAPGLCDVSHLLADPRLCKIPLVVLIVRRPLEQIIASCARVNWDSKREREKYLSRPEFGPYFVEGQHVAKWKYDVLDGFQRPLIRALGGVAYYYQIAYEDLSAHPLWLPAEERKGWEWDRTAPGKGGRSE